MVTVTMPTDDQDSPVQTARDAGGMGDRLVDPSGVGSSGVVDDQRGVGDQGVDPGVGGGRVVGSPGGVGDQRVDPGVVNYRGDSGDRSVPAGHGHPDVRGRRSEIIAGAGAMAPVMVGYLPFGVLLGTAIARNAEPWAAWSGTEMIYGGSAHLTLIEMLRTGSGLWAAVGAAVLINARLLVYSSALIPLWGSARRFTRLLAAAFIIDPTWMLAVHRADQGGTLAQRRAHFAGAAAVLTIGWTVAVTAGMVLGSVVAPAGVLEVTVPLCLMAIVAPHLRVRGGLAAVSVAVAVTALTTSWPAGSGMLLAMTAAAACGALAPGRSSRSDGSARPGRLGRSQRSGASVQPGRSGRPRRSGGFARRGRSGQPRWSA